MLNVGQICEVCWFELFFGIVQLLTVSQHVRVLVFQFLYFVLCTCYVFFCSIFFVFHKTGFWSSWLIQQTADLSKQRRKGTMSSHLEMFDILKALLLLHSTGVGFASCHRCC